jgi:hypothetical protein
MRKREKREGDRWENKEGAVRHGERMNGSFARTKLGKDTH